MRGKLLRSLPLRRLPRITPAHAGKTYRLRAADYGSEDHPRACGENSLRTHRRQRRRGSPPRMRGKPSKSYAYNSRVRITPAHAGKTPPRVGAGQLTGDHPRACGENLRTLRAVILLSGSPPRMRGKHCPFCSYKYRTGITPAHAGKTHKN